MITDSKILPKLESVASRYAAIRFEKIADVPVEMTQTRAHLHREPNRRQAHWRKAPGGTRWGGDWVTAWFRGDATLPPSCAGKKVFVRAKIDAETLFFVNGEPNGVFDENHPVVLMTRRGQARRIYHLAFEAYAGHGCPGTQPNDNYPPPRPGCKRFDGIELMLERQDVTDFVFDLQTLIQLARTLDENSLRRGRIIAALAKVFAVVAAMPEEAGEAQWRPKLPETQAIMRPLLACRNGPTAPFMGIVGHSHLDTAWLWPMAETERKCARTFSSMLNLMDQYPELTFIQNVPAHAEMVERVYPSLFRRMRAMVQAGRWEANGCMWVEPDCNIPSGESLVRQLLVGQRELRRMFGRTGNTLWQPDVFGYSAALPQILRGAGVEFFLTTKIAWNDTTRFPYDTFVWKGIDGSSVLTHFNSIHCWPDPATMTAHWNWLQHKDVEDRRLMAIGYGDGGGGPQCEMMEMARRVKDLEGCPRSGYTTVGRFMRGIQRDLLPMLPEYYGELFLELHRGTLTSIARIKRYNRKIELALREAEFLCTMAALRGARYPVSKLAELWKVLLTNQFHDILPGTSIAQVNDAATESFARCLAETNALAAGAARRLAGGRTTSPAAILLNSLSWDRDGEMELDAIPAGLVPASRDVPWQRIKNIDGRKSLVIAGVRVPAMSSATIPLAPRTRRQRSAFKLNGYHLETPHATVVFDAMGRIVSLLHKATGRQVVRAGGALNTFWLGEDIPRSWDTWDIDRDQQLKMRSELKLVRRSVIADGPLQLRIRSICTLGTATTITQDMVFHARSAQIDFQTVIDWHEKHKLLKVGFELDVLAENARHEIQYGHLERPTHANLPHDQARFEVCAHKWTDLSDGGFGVALLNDCKYGVGVNGGEIRLSLIKGGTRPDPRADAGRHVMTYALLPHTGSFAVQSVVHPACELNVPLTVVIGPPSTRPLQPIVTVDAPNVIVESIKWAEDSKAFVVRLYEAGKQATNTTVRFAPAVKAVLQTNLLEEMPHRLEFRNASVRLPMRPFEIKTLLCTL